MIILLAQKTGDEMLLFHYDENGSPLGFQYRNGTYASGVFDEYIYEKNLQGDIVAIYNNVGTYLVSYTYDAWGNVNKGYYNGGSNTGAAKNPLTYRAYYYDQDLGLYYLQSRYYDATIGRFVNADAYLSTGTGLLGYNMYSYCNNNPVNYVDSDGQNPLLGAAATNPVAFLAVASALLLGLLVEAVIDYEETVDKIEESIDNAKAKIQTQWLLLMVAAEYAFSKVKSTFKEDDNPIVFPTDPNSFNPNGLTKVYRAGTKNGALISWMDPTTNEEIFRWDENPNFKDGPHYHMHSEGHYYPGEIVPEPYASLYFFE